MLTYRNAVCACFIGLLIAISYLPAASRTLSLEYNGRPAPIPIRLVNDKPSVALMPLARWLQIPVRRLNGTLQVEVENSWLVVTPGDLTVRQDGAPMLRLTTLPHTHGGQLFIDARDIPALLEIDAVVRGRNISLEKQLNQQSAAFNVRQLPTPTPRPTPKPAPTSERSALSVPQGKHLVGTMNFVLQNQATAQYYQFNADAGTPGMHTTLYANGSPGTRAYVGGIVTLGAGKKHATIGSVPDPLYGALFSSSSDVGGLFENRSGTTVTWATSTFGGRHVIAVSHANAHVNKIVAFVSGAGSVPQLLAGLQQTNATANGEFDRELWLGPAGAGAGVHYRSNGRFYTEERLGIATSRLPLLAGEAPTEANVGYDVSSAFGIRAGIAAARTYGDRPFAQLYGRIKDLQLGLVHAAGQSSISANISESGTTAFLDYGRASSSSFLNFMGTLALRKGALEANAYQTQGQTQSRDVWVDYRLKGTAPSMSFGVESISSSGVGRTGLTAGYSVPFGTTMIVGVEVHPLIHGEGLRFSVQHSLLVADHYAQPHFVVVSLQNISETPVYTVVDGLRGQQLSGESARISVPAGTHYVAVQSADGKLASPETRVIDGTPGSVNLPLWPVLEIQGSLKIANDADAALFASHPSLAGIAVVIQPGNIVVQSDERGYFDFPAQPLAPGSSLTIDPQTLPEGLAPPAAQAISASQNIVITLHASKKVQKVIF